MQALQQQQQQQQQQWQQWEQQMIRQVGLTATLQTSGAPAKS
jgi:hypothetical protein